MPKNPQIKMSEQQAQALEWFVAGETLEGIARRLGSTRQTVTRWRDRFNWLPQRERVPLKLQIADRIDALIVIVDKTPGQIKELELLLCAVNDDYARRLKPKEFARGQVALSKTQAGTKVKKNVKNSFGEITNKDFEQHFVNQLFGYQRQWLQAKQDIIAGKEIKNSEGKLVKMPRNRAIVKSRQIGATWYFAAEAFQDAVLSGDNQIFISASKKQALIFQRYIKQFAMQWFGVRLIGTEEIVLANGAVIKFLATNGLTAMGYNGHVYMDEFFWIRNFKEFRKLAIGMASHKKYRRTYFSTMSALSHDGYELWSGASSLMSKKKANIDLSPKTLKYGSIGSDKIWRMQTNLRQAEEMGCNFFDFDELKDETPAAEFANLYMCKPVDDSESVFRLSVLQKGLVEPESWEDYKPESHQPLAQVPVWIGYDPARSVDDASMAIIAPPIVAGGNFRMIERFRLKHQTFEQQALKIKEMTKRYNVAEIIIDSSGMGLGVYERVREFFARAVPIQYTAVIKEQMVAKMLDVFNSGRFEYQDPDSSIQNSFLAIGKKASSSGKIIITAKRSEKTGHADVAFAIMHAIYQEPTNAKHLNRKSSLAIALGA